MNKLLLILAFAISCRGVKAQDQFTNNGNLKFHNGSTVTFFGNFSNNGAFSDSSQMITFGGTSLQTIGGSSVCTFNNITLKNTAGAALSASEQLKGILTVNDGTFTTTGHTFTLLSDANRTASIGPITGNFAGDITMQRYLGAGPTDWRFLASPVENATMLQWKDDFTISGFPQTHFPNFPFVSVYGYNESVSGNWNMGYTVPASINDPIDPGHGFWTWIGPGPLTVDVTGPPAKFQHNFQVSFTQSGGTDNDGWTMAGNPYPSAIDWDATAWTKVNMNKAIYIWNPQLQQYSSWVAGVGVNGGSSIIASSQAFWVQANAANPVLQCNESVKSSQDRSFIRETNETFSFDLLKLKLSGNGYADETYIRFDDMATNVYDAELDARKAFTTSPGVPSLCSVDLNNNDLSVNSLPVSSTISIPVKALVSVSGSYTITLDTLSSELPGHCMVLEDLVTGIRTDLMNTPSYTFSIADTTVSARFILHISSSAVNILATAASCYGTTDGSAVASAGSGPKDYIWTNASNDTIRTSLQLSTADTLQHIPGGAYMVTIIDAASACGTVTQGFVIDQPNALMADFVLSDDTLILGINDTLFAVNNTIDASAFYWNFGDGTAADTLETPAPHVFQQAGTYTVSLIAAHAACSDSSGFVVVVMNAPASVGLNHAAAGTSLLVFPNPSDGQFSISLPAAAGADAVVEIYNLLGAKIHSAALHEGANAIDMSTHAKGIYSYRVFAGAKQLFTGQLILQ